MKVQESLDIREAAQIAKLSPETIRDWIKAGKLAARAEGPQGRYRIAPADLTAFLSRPSR